MTKFYNLIPSVVLMCTFIIMSVINVNAQQFDVCADAKSLDELMMDMSIGEIVTSDEYDNSNATGGEETNPNRLICLFDESIDNSLWFSFTGDGNTYSFTTAYCGIDSSEYLNTSQALLYKGDCNNLEFISCNEFQQEVQPTDPINFTFKTRFGTEVGVTYYILIDGSTGLGEPYNETGKFCLEVQRLPEIDCDSDGLKFVVERAPEQSYYVCWLEFCQHIITELEVPLYASDEGRISGYIVARGNTDLTDVSDPYNDFDTEVDCCSNADWRIDNYIHGFFGPDASLYGQTYFKYYYYVNAPIDPEFEFPILSAADCVIESNTVEVFLLPEDSDINISSVIITNSTTTSGNGKIDIEATGGSGIFEYFWSNGSEGQDIQDLEPGDYSVTITDISFCFPPVVETFTIEGSTAIEMLENDGNLLSVHPNPSNGLLKLSSSHFDSPDVDITIFTTTGQQAIQFQVDFSSNTEQNIDLGHLDNGIYILSAKDENTVITERIILQK